MTFVEHNKRVVRDREAEKNKLAQVKTERDDALRKNTGAISTYVSKIEKDKETLQSYQLYKNFLNHIAKSDHEENQKQQKEAIKHQTKVTWISRVRNPVENFMDEVLFGDEELFVESAVELHK